MPRPTPRSPQRRELLTAALEIAARGWPVFPLKPGGSFPALHGLDDCPGTGACADGHRKWEERATTDTAVIERCWSHDAYNIGIAPGPVELVVLDFDMPKPGKPVPDHWTAQGATCGLDVFLLVCADAGQTPPLDTFTVQTPSGGTHLYFTAPADIELRCTQGERGNGLGWGIDTRAHGGYVVAPGSIRRDGRYTITDDRPPIPLPGWLVERLRPAPPPPQRPAPVATLHGRRSRYLESAITAEVRRMETAAAQGQGRNESLYLAAIALGQLVAGGALTEAEVRDVLLHAAAQHVAAGAYGWRQAELTITSGFRAGAKRPRKVAA